MRMSQETAKAALCPTRLIGVCLSVLNTPSPLADVRLPVNMCLCVFVVPHHPSSPVIQLDILHPKKKERKKALGLSYSSFPRR